MPSVVCWATQSQALRMESMYLAILLKTTAYSGLRPQDFTRLFIVRRSCAEMNCGCSTEWARSGCVALILL